MPRYEYKDAKKIAREVFGIKKPHSHQKKAWKAIAKGKSVFLVVATGGGKTAAFQVPALLLKGITVIVSPLIALMREQVERLIDQGVAAVRITHDMTGDDQADAIRRIKKGKVKIVYTSPERLKTKKFQKVLETQEISLIAIDEVHCCSIYQKDFRPSYGAIRPFCLKHPKAIRIGVTATADEEVEYDSVRALAIRKNYKRIVGVPYRENLTFRSEKDADVRDVVSNIRTYLGDKPRKKKKWGCAIIYCASRKNVDGLARDCRMMLPEMEVEGYHAGLSRYNRNRVQDLFMRGKLQVVAATNAFGMGIDRPDVRLVYHYDPPESVFSYVQESGRSGRDGKEAWCVLNISDRGMNLRKFLIRLQNPAYYVYERLWRIFYTLKGSGIFRQSALGTFGGTGDFPTKAVSAVQFMEHNKLVTTAPGSLYYTACLLRANQTIEMLDRRDIKYDINDGNANRKVLKFAVSPGDSSAREMVSRMLRRKLISEVKIDPEFIITRRSNEQTCPVSEKDVIEKEERAMAKVDALPAFAAATNKAGFLKDIFL